MKIEIYTNHDDHDCDICGWHWAEGGQVYVDGKLVLQRDAEAHCFDGQSYSEAELLILTLAKIGIHVYVDDEKYHVCQYDEEYHGE